MKNLVLLYITKIWTINYHFRASRGVFLLVGAIFTVFLFKWGYFWLLLYLIVRCCRRRVHIWDQFLGLGDKYINFCTVYLIKGGGIQGGHIDWVWGVVWDGRLFVGLFFLRHSGYIWVWFMSRCPFSCTLYDVSTQLFPPLFRTFRFSFNIRPRSNSSCICEAPLSNLVERLKFVTERSYFPRPITHPRDFPGNLRYVPCPRTLLFLILFFILLPQCINACVKWLCLCFSMDCGWYRSVTMWQTYLCTFLSPRLVLSKN